MTDEYLERALDFIRDKAEDYARAKSMRVYLMEFRKSKRSILMRNAEKRGFKTAALQEREAYADPEYIELLDGIQAAVELEESLSYQMKAAELKIDVWRSKEATKRSERARYGA